MVDWTNLISTLLAPLGTTAIILASFTYLAKASFKQILERDIASHVNALRQASDRTRALLENELKFKADTALNSQKDEFERRMKNYESDLTNRSARSDRIREQVLKWANPILAAVGDLEKRLENILSNDGYNALSRDCYNLNSGWSIQYDYFMPSSVYLFGQFFCYIRLFEQNLSFEIFEKNETKDKFFHHARAVGKNLSSYPLKELIGLPGEKEDCQIFTLEQRAIGENMTIYDNNDYKCMGYAEFVERWDDKKFQEKFKSLIRLIDGLSRSNQHRWRRLELSLESLKKLRSECERLLEIRDSHNQLPEEMCRL